MIDGVGGDVQPGVEGGQEAEYRRRVEAAYPIQVVAYKSSRSSWQRCP
ncbi:MAG: hypothetical protein H0V96_07425 [Acidimicrobiia bacterium]|nr:hypothetical protein [Acidimicrobiia bacterium]